MSVNPIVDAAAWKTHPGPILLLAGPGTGKTHQLALRVKNLVENEGANPQAITVITFTTEAAKNMLSRISDEGKPDVFIPPEKRPGRISTMHSLGLEIIRQYHDDVSLPADFKVVTDPSLRRTLFLDSALLSGATEEQAKAADSSRQATITLALDSPIAPIVAQYEALLRVNKAIDYDDQILLANRILDTNSDALEK